MRKTVCYAYFGDGKFLGWYSDSFGSITKNKPKLYGYDPAQNQVVTDNFRYKVKKEVKKLADLMPVLKLVDDSNQADKNLLSNYTQLELRVVECPVYDGPNVNFDEKRHQNWIAYNRTPLYEPCNHRWIYADYQLVRGWALAEPTNFLETITAE